MLPLFVLNHHIFASAVYPVTSFMCAGTSTPPSIAATPVPALPPPIAVNSYASVPAPPSAQSATEALYTNGVHAYQGTATPCNSPNICVITLTVSVIILKQ